MPAPSETLPALERRLAERLLAFERLDEAWPFSHLPRVAVRPALVRTVRPMIPGKPEARFCARLSPWNAAPRSRSRPRTRRLRLSENPTASQPRSPKSDHPYRRPDHLTRFHPSRRPPRARDGAEGRGQLRSTRPAPWRTAARGGLRCDLGRGRLARAAPHGSPGAGQEARHQERQRRPAPAGLSLVCTIA